MTPTEELEKFLNEKVCGSRNNNGNPKEIVLGEIDVIVFDDGHCALQIGKAIIGKHSFVAFELGTAEEYDEWLEKLIAEKTNNTYEYVHNQIHTTQK